MNASPVVIRRVVLRNYKSIAACDVSLAPLTFLVGANGSGKSNFLDSLRFLSDSLRTSLDPALRDRAPHCGGSLPGNAAAGQRAHPRRVGSGRSKRHGVGDSAA